MKSLWKYVKGLAVVLIRSVWAPERTLPPSLDPRLGDAVRESTSRARRNFLAGQGLGPLVRLAESGVSIHTRVVETMPGASESVHFVSITQKSPAPSGTGLPETANLQRT